MIINEIDLKALTLKDNLNPKIWDKNGIINPEVKKNLLAIANEFFDELQLSTELLDITLTGSLANYNWSEYSDIDLHLIVDYKDITKKLDNSGKIFKDVPEFIADYFSSKKELWNKKHDITIHKFDVEVYIQNIREKHYSNGVYSLLNNEWLITPSHVEYSIDETDLVKKIKEFKNKIDTLSNPNSLNKLKDKLVNLRKLGLSKDGEFSFDNILYKVLRREGYIDKLINKIGDIYDKDLSINEDSSSDSKKLFLVKLKNDLVFFKKSSKTIYNAVYIYVYGNNDHVIKSWSMNDKKLPYFIKEAKKWNKIKTDILNSEFTNLNFQKITGVYMVKPSIVKNILDIENITFSDLKFAEIK